MAYPAPQVCELRFSSLRIGLQSELVAATSIWQTIKSYLRSELDGL